MWRIKEDDKMVDDSAEHFARQTAGQPDLHGKIVFVLLRQHTAAKADSVKQVWYEGEIGWCKHYPSAANTVFAKQA